MIDTLATTIGSPNSKIVEEALKLIQQHQDIITTRASKITTLTEDEILDLEEYINNRREKEQTLRGDNLDKFMKGGVMEEQRGV